MSTGATDARATPTNVDEKLKKELVTILLKVYMSGRYTSWFVILRSMLSFSSFSKQRAIDR